MTSLTRRAALVGAGSSAAVLVSGSSSARAGAVVPAVAGWTEAASGEGAFAIGRHCLALTAVGCDVPELVDRLEAATDGGGGLRRPQELLEALRRVVSEEFRANRVVRVGGWVLSESEARFYALTTLVSASR